MIALYVLAATSDLKGSVTLQETMQTAAGPWGGRLTSAVVAVYCFGTCITFLIIIGDQFDRAFASLVGPEFCHKWFLNRNFVMPATSILFILPLCYSKTIDFLQYVSMAGVLTILYVVLLIVAEYLHGGHDPGPIKTRPEAWTDVFAVIPVICFGYQCHVSVIPIYSCMKHRTIKHFSLATSIAILICVLVYTGAATFGYLTFGSKVSGDILSDYSATKPSVMVALIAMAAKTYTTYPILLFCGREGLDSLYRDLVLGGEDTPGRERLRRMVIATAWFVLSIVLAIEIPDIGAVINMLGSLAAVFIFVFPGVCLLQTALAGDPGLATAGARLRVSGAFAFLLLGAFLFGVVLTQALATDLSGADQAAPLCTVSPRTGNSSYVKLWTWMDG
jgi:sodium-coupled neutral amino acid transporter 7/8